MRNRSFPPRLAAAAAFALGAVGGCAVGPPYRTPDTPLPARYDGAREAAAYTDGVPVAEYWRTFDDPVLSQLVDDALHANRDLRAALANLRAARALRRESLYSFAPTVTAGGGRTRARTTAAESALTSQPREGTLWDAGFDAYWEIDLFGAVRRRARASAAEALAADAGAQFVRITVASEVVRSYFELRGAQERLDVARRNAANQATTLRLTEVRLRAGRGTELDRARAAAQLLNTRAAIPTLEALVRTTGYRLGVLVGSGPEAVQSRLDPPRALPALPETLAIGAPGDLLRRRPDVRQAERLLAASTARVGVAVADFFPRVSLVGSAGSVAGRAGDLYSSDTEVFSIGPRLDWAFLDLGRVRERLVRSRADAERSLVLYEQAVLRALEDADAALVRYDRSRAREALLREAAAESATAAALARRRFEGGASDFLTVLDAERSQLDAEDRLAQSRAESATGLVAVYKALGGGWNER